MISLRPLIGAPALALAVATACAGTRLSPSPAPRSAVSATALREGLSAFAHDSMMGREAGTVWNEKATDYVASRLRMAGVEPAGEAGTYFQIVPRIASRDPSAPPGSARNVIGVIRGSDTLLRQEFVAITAHNDHIGYNHRPVDHDSLRAFNTIVRPLGADSPNRPAFNEEATRIRRILDSLRAVHTPRLDSISNGADDDGSGTIALLEIARALASSGVRPRRSILLVSHTAEEKGLLGSAWFTDHPTVPLDAIVAEFDVDMIGRGAATDIAKGGPTYLEVVGLRRLSKEFGDWVEAANARETVPFVFNYEYDAPGHPEQYYCRADHYNYARYGIPSVSLSRGSHRDYHQVTDEPQYIDYPDYSRLVQMVLDAAVFVANADHRPRLDAPKPSNPHVPCRQ
ncbi:MAG TPA: M20/M25/M40 family metallo-hydrolase [Gemmatimonadaceae bacterium]|nr:M20/M25/M40 family metallo-hydrolase [Gemmatimonadaceae bacterium]